MPKFFEIKQEVMIALKASYSDIIEKEKEISTRFERIIEFLSHEAQRDRFYKQENRALCLYLDRAAILEKKLVDKHLNDENYEHDTKYLRLLELKQKIENIY